MLYNYDSSVDEDNEIIEYSGYRIKNMKEEKVIKKFKENRKGPVKNKSKKPQRIKLIELENPNEDDD